MMMIPLNALRFGEEATPPINCRRVGRDSDIEGMSASLAAHGLIHPLVVRTIDGQPYVSDGNRRLRAYRLLVDAGELAADAPIRCEEMAADQDAEEISLAANVMSEPLHEADTYETFHDLHERGQTPAAIAARFGVEEARVHRMLKLGALSPVILEAWRNDEFRHDALGVVRAFTLAPSLKEQERVFNKLKAHDQLHSNVVRREFGAGDQEAARAVKFVGVDAYTASGGEIILDLFGDDHVIVDRVLAIRLREDKFNTLIDGYLRDDGWAWAARADELPYSWSYNWQKLKPASGELSAEEKKQVKKLQREITRIGGTETPKGKELDDQVLQILARAEKRPFNDDQKAKAGVVIQMANDGSAIISLGVVRPTAPKRVDAANSASAGATGTASEKKSVLSNALHQRLSAQATLATREALIQEPKLGLAALLAGFIADSGGMYNPNPIRVSHQGFGKQYSTEREGFAGAFGRLSKEPVEELVRIAAGIASEAVHLERAQVGRLPFDDDAAPLAAAIEPTLINEALLAHFDAQDYFTSASKPFVLKAIEEATNADEARKAEKLKKAELVALAMDNVPRTGWLPPELRPATYTGPGGASEIKREAAE